MLFAVMVLLNDGVNSLLNNSTVVQAPNRILILRTGIVIVDMLVTDLNS